MKKLLGLLMVVALTVTAAPKVMTERAVKGEWTMDYEAAKEASKAEDVPMMVLFTGSDWCSWCKLMDEKVFSQKEWKDYAKGNLYLAYIDFPQNQELVPKQYRGRNSDLAKSFGIEGYPTMIILSGDGEEVIRLSADREITAEKFIKDIRLSLLFTPPELAKIYAKLPAEEMTALKACGDRRREILSAINKLEDNRNKMIEKVNKKFDEDIEKLQEEYEKAQCGDFTDKVLETLFKQKGNGQLDVFLAKKQEMKTVNQSFEEWLSGSPEKNDANDKIFAEFTDKQKKLAKELADMIIGVLP